MAHLINDISDTTQGVLVEKMENNRIMAFFSKPLISGLMGMALLLPATYFLMTLVLRICFGSATLYHSLAPSFLQSPFVPFAWHKAQFIIGCVVLAILFNLLTIFRFRLQPGSGGPKVAISYRRYWLNTAVTLQSVLLFLALVTYILIQHIRY